MLLLLYEDVNCVLWANVFVDLSYEEGRCWRFI